MISEGRESPGQREALEFLDPGILPVGLLTWVGHRSPAKRICRIWDSAKNMSGRLYTAIVSAKNSTMAKRNPCGPTSRRTARARLLALAAPASASLAALSLCILSTAESTTGASSRKNGVTTNQIPAVMAICAGVLAMFSVMSFL